jgi:hypothetical protein
MSAPVEFSVRFIGESPGVFTGALSVAAFHGPLTNLLRALRHNADEVASADSTNRRRRRVGKHFDLQLTSVTEGSLRLAFVFVPILGVAETRATDPADAKIASAAVTQFVADVKREWDTAGAGDTAAHKYLTSLPPGIVTQEYEAREGDRVLTSATLSRKVESEESVDFRAIAPRLRLVQGTIRAIYFNQPEGSVKIRLADEPAITCRATAELLDVAARLHKTPVTARLLVKPGFARLLELRAADEPPPSAPGPEERRKYILSRWAKTLAKLAE